jgi:hypothetical protein
VAIDWQARARKLPRPTRAQLRHAKRLARAAVAHRSGEVALRVCDLIVDYDLFIGESPNHQPPGFARIITTTYPALCQKCGRDIPPGHQAVWYDNDQCWHLGCAPRDDARFSNLLLPLGGH